MPPNEFVERYRDQMTLLGVGEGTDVERIEQARTALGSEEKDVAIGHAKVRP
jgi:chitin synthase